MFRRRDERGDIAEGDSETVLGRVSNFKGTLKAEGTVKIFGVVEGEIETAGKLIVGKTAKVLATVTAKEVSVAGAIKGNITAASRLEILTSGRVYGDVSAPSLMIEEGAVFSGQCLMGSKEGEPLLLQAPDEAE